MMSRGESVRLSTSDKVQLVIALAAHLAVLAVVGVGMWTRLAVVETRVESTEQSVRDVEAAIRDVETELRHQRVPAVAAQPGGH